MMENIGVESTMGQETLATTWEDFFAHSTRHRLLQILEEDSREKRQVDIDIGIWSLLKKEYPQVIDRILRYSLKWLEEALVRAQYTMPNDQ
jgi:hypothetical protein